MIEKQPPLEMLKVFGMTDGPKGKRALIEGLDSDTTQIVSCLPTFLTVDVPESVGTLRLEGCDYRFWPPTLGLRDQLTLSEQSVAYLKYIGAVRALILEDGRMFVREYEIDNWDYIDRLLSVAVKVALDRFGQCQGAGFFALLTD